MPALPSVTLTTDKPSYRADETIVATYHAEPVVTQGTLTGSVQFASGTYPATGQVEVRDEPVSYSAPVLAGWTFVVDPANPTTFRGTHNA